MNRLQKKAWIELIGVTVCVIIAGTCCAILVKMNAKGLDTMLIGVGVGLLAGLFVYIKQLREFRKFDERERAIYQRAFKISTNSVIILWAIVSFFILFINGADGAISAYVPFVIFFTGLFLGQFVQSAVILIQCAMEQPSEQSAQ